MNMQINCIWKGPAALGEGPVWHVKEKSLYWVDIAEPRLHRLPVNGDYQSWELPDIIGAIAPRAAGGLIGGVGGNLVIIECFPFFQMTRIKEVLPKGSLLRFNDGKCDRKGRFWVGVASVDLENPKGGLFCLDLDGSLKQIETGITISNGLGFSPDDKHFYYTDGLRYTVYRYNFDLNSGKLSNRHAFITLPKGVIEPDGLTVDSEGCIWEAQWNSGHIFRFSPNGQLDRKIKMPVKRPTSCMFGLETLDVLYVTSCSRGLDETKVLPPPAGAVFALDVGVKGLPEPMFLG